MAGRGAGGGGAPLSATNVVPRGAAVVQHLSGSRQLALALVLAIALVRLWQLGKLSALLTAATSAPKALGQGHVAPATTPTGQGQGG